MACQNGAMFREVLEPCQSAQVRSQCASRGAECLGSLIQSEPLGPPAADTTPVARSASTGAGADTDAAQLCLPYAPTQYWAPEVGQQE